MSTESRHDYYLRLRRAGVVDAAASVAADRAFPDAVQRDARIREKEEQAAIIKLFRAHGFTVRSTSQSRASRVALGLPDLWVTHNTKPLAFWFEVKRQSGGVLSEFQKDFAADCERCGVKCMAGDRYHAEAFLRSQGL